MTTPLPQRLEATRLAVEEPSQVYAARALGARVAAGVGLEPEAAHRLDLVTAELAENLHRYATGGEVLLVPPHAHGASSMLRVYAVDRGPGVEAFHRCLEDGFTTAGSMGTGLGAARRLADEFAAVSEPGTGTVVRAGFRVPGVAALRDRHFAIGAVGFPVGEEAANGDDFAVLRRGARLEILVADGLGHGPSAAAASGAAVDRFLLAGTDAPAARVADLSRRLTSSRGAAVTVASLDVDTARDGGQMSSAGLGNVSLLVAGPDGETKRIMTSMGTAGVRSPRRVSEQHTAFPPSGVLVLHTDGLGSRWTLEGRQELLRQPPDVVAAALWRDHARGSDDSLVVVVRAVREGDAA